MPLPGEHNVRNALAAIAIASDEGVDDAAIVAGSRVSRASGAAFQVQKLRIGTADVTLVDDYGHHPTEVAAVFGRCASVGPGRRVVMVYQPHRFTRTRDLYDDFVRVLSDVDLLLLARGVCGWRSADRRR